MRYFSEDYTPCVTRASGFCNVPNKARFNPTEQMIVAYHKGTVVYAYKGLFNRNIDYNWSGAILLDFVTDVDLVMVYNRLLKIPMPLVLHLISIHLTTTRGLNVTHIRVHLKFLLTVGGRAVDYLNQFQAARHMSK